MRNMYIDRKQKAIAERTRTSDSPTRTLCGCNTYPTWPDAQYMSINSKDGERLLVAPPFMHDRLAYARNQGGVRVRR